MTTDAERLNFITSFLTSLTPVKAVELSLRSELIFEVFCYFRKAFELADRRKTMEPQNLDKGVFRCHLKPGEPKAPSTSYMSFKDAKGKTFDLFLNGSFEGKSGVKHSPDLVLREAQDEKILSIYECKNHSGKLDLGYYREFIGFLEEMRIPKHNAIFRDYDPELRPSIYTSAAVNSRHSPLLSQYDFDVVDRL